MNPETSERLSFSAHSNSQDANGKYKVLPFLPYRKFLERIDSSFLTISALIFVEPYGIRNSGDRGLNKDSCG